MGGGEERGVENEGAGEWRRGVGGWGGEKLSPPFAPCLWITKTSS